MASPYTMVAVSDLPIAGSASMLEGQSGRTLQEASRIRIYLNRESVDVTFSILVGKENVLESGAGAAINATDGDLPSTRDDLLVDTFGLPGDEILIKGSNVNAALQEGRAIVMVTPVDDVVLQNAMAAVGA